MVPKFECKRCGSCCRNMRGRLEKKPPILPLDIFSAVPRSEQTVALFEWEILFLQKKAKEFSVEFKAVPSMMFWDEVSMLPIVKTWNLDHNNCPFLSKENLCLVHRQKPLGCQTYPLLRKNERDIIFMDCPHIIYPPHYENGRAVNVTASKLLRMYGSVFRSMNRFHSIKLLMDDCLANLKREWILFPAIIDEDLKKMLLRERPVGLLEHLRNKCPWIAENLENEIRTILSLKRDKD